MTWGFVEWYTCVLIVLSIVMSIVMDGKPKSQKTHSFNENLASWLLLAPPVGRAMGWF